MLVYVRIPPKTDYSLVAEAGEALTKNGITGITGMPNGTFYENGVLAHEAVTRCDAILVLPGGNNADVFSNQGLPVYYWPELPKRSSTEVKYPEQAHGFMEKIMKMYRVHLRKNEDYSPANIMGAGQIGIATRMWDKMARLMNLVGFNVEIASTEYKAPKEPKHESIDDNSMDLSVYGIIFQLYREGRWAK